MRQSRSETSPITYYISESTHAEWVLLLHAAFVDHRMFQSQISHFKNQYNILAVDIIGHGQSTDAGKRDGIDKMSPWIYDIMRTEKIEKLHVVGVSLGAVLAQDFANLYPDAVLSLACFGGYDINHFDIKLQKENSASQMLMMLKAFVSVKWFAKANRKISAYTPQAQNEFYDMNCKFPKKSFMYLASLNKLINVHATEPRTYPLLIGCGEFDIPMELTAIEMWKRSEPLCKTVIFKNAGHCVNMDAPEKFNAVMEEFWQHARSSHI